MLNKLKNLLKEKPKRLNIHSNDGDSYILIHTESGKVLGPKDSLIETLNLLNEHLNELKVSDNTIKPLNIINDREWESYGFIIVKKESLHNFRFDLLDY